jgi:hypothetical protein
LSVCFRHPACFVLENVSNGSISDPVIEIKCENKNRREVIPIDPIHFYPYLHYITKEIGFCARISTLIVLKLIPLLNNIFLKIKW